MQLHTLARAVGIALLSSALLPAYAQQVSSAEELDRVVVTAQKREQQVQDVPLAVTAYSGEFIENLGVTGLGDLSLFVPGLQVQEQSPNNPGYVIRGITSDSGAANQQARVSIFQDGISLSRARGASVELFDMQRVEVLRGPQGTLFGRAAQTGAVHYIQNKAGPGNDGRVRVGAGNFNQRLIEGHYNAELGADALYARAAFFHESRDGAYENLAGGRLNGKDTTALRLGFGMLMGEASRVDVIFNTQRDAGPGTAFRSGSIPTRQGSTDPFAAGDLNRGDALGLNRRVHSITALGEFPLNDAWTLNTVSGWRAFNSHEEFDADGSQLPALEFAEIANGRQFSHEMRLNFDNGNNFAGFVGASYFYETGEQRVPFTTDERSLLALLLQDDGIRTQISQLMWSLRALPVGTLFPRPPVLNPDGSPFLGLGAMMPPGFVLKPVHTEGFANYGQTKSFDVFADGTWNITPQFDLTAGVRVTREELTGGYQGFRGNAPSLLGGLGTGSPAPGTTNILNLATNGKIERTESFTSAVGRLAVHYDFADNLSGYASFSRGRRPEVISVTPQGSEVLPAEIVNSLEGGLKGAFNDGRFVYDLTAFRYQYSNFQTDMPNPDGLVPPIVPTNAGNASAYGVEASLYGRVMDNLTAFANTTWMRARFDDKDGDGNAQIYGGNRFRLTPDQTFSVGLDWTIPMGAASLYVRPAYSWQSKVYFEDDNDELLSQDSYGLASLRAGVRLADGRWDIGVWGNNLTGEKFLIDAGNTGRLFGTPTFIPGNPRMYGFTVTAKF